MIERAGGNNITPETHPELYAFPGPRESSGLREELAKMSMQVLDLKLTVERVRALLEMWEVDCSAYPQGLLPVKSVVKFLKAALEGDRP